MFVNTSRHQYYNLRLHHRVLAFYVGLYLCTTILTILNVYNYNFKHNLHTTDFTSMSYRCPTVYFDSALRFFSCCVVFISGISELHDVTIFRAGPSTLKMVRACNSEAPSMLPTPTPTCRPKS